MTELSQDRLSFPQAATEMAVCSVRLVPFRKDTLSLMSCSYSLIFFSHDDSGAWWGFFLFALV